MSYYIGHFFQGSNEKLHDGYAMIVANTIVFIDRRIQCAWSPFHFIDINEVGFLPGAEE